MSDAAQRILELEERCRNLEKELAETRLTQAREGGGSGVRKDLERAQALARLGSWQFNLNDETVTASEVTRRIYGVPDGPLTIREVQAIPLSKYRAAMDAAFEALLKEGKPYDLEFQIQRPSDGAIRWIHSMAEYDAERNVVVGTLHDLTEQKQAEEAIRRHKERLEAVVEVLQQHDRTLQDFLDFALEKALAITDSKLGYIYFYDEDAQQFKLNTWSREVMDECTVLEPETCYELSSTGFWGEAVRQQRPMLLNDFQAQHPLKKGVPEGHVTLERFLTVPIFRGSRIVAVVGVANQEDPYDETDILQLKLLMDAVWEAVEHRKAQDALKASEHKFRSFIENANDIVYSLTPQGRFSYVSANWLDLLGEPPGEALGRSFEHYVHPEDVHLCRDFLTRVLTREERQASVEYRVRHADGSWRWHVSSGSPMRDQSGKVTSYVGIARDVTDRREHESRLAILAQMLDEAPAAITIHDMDGEFLFANREAYRVHGHDSEQELDDPALQTLTVGEGSALDSEHLQQIAQAGEVRFEADHVRRDGSTVWLEVLAKAIEWQGRSAVLNLATDITERKRAERALEESHALLADLAGMVPGVIYQYRLYPDGSSAFPYASPGMYAIYEVTPEEVREDATPVFGRLHPEDAQEVSDAIFESARTQEMFYAEFRVNLPEQGLRWRWSQARPQLLEDGSTLWHGIILDATDRKQAEEDRERLQKQLDLSQRIESVGRLAGGVAHDFNNMLNVILGHAEILLTDLPPASTSRNDVKEIERAALRSADLTRQLLAFARKQTIAPRILDLNATIVSLLKMLQRLIGEDIHLLWAPGSDLDPVLIDPGQVDQILVNLCVNARDAIGGDIGRITIETANVEIDEEFCADHPGFTTGRFVILAVSDDGCGMDEETRARIFEPFFTTKGLGEGTGLGLSTVYGIVKQNAGFINAYSEPGQGSTFRIYLPVPQDPPMRKRAEQGHTAEIVAGTETVLLVEDEEALLHLSTRMMTRLGYRVIPAHRPAEALDLAREHESRIHLLITDVVMPEMNGRDLANELLSLHPEMKCLFISGYTANVIAHHGVLDEGVHFLQKPFSMAQLAGKLRAVLDDEEGVRPTSP